MPVYFRLFMLFNTREPENGNRIAKHKKQECEHFFITEKCSHSIIICFGIKGEKQIKKDW